MLFVSIVIDYFKWHYSRAFSELFHVWMNFVWFVIHFFSLSELAHAWFAPFKRLTEERGSLFSFEDLAGFVIINLFSRLLGALLRTILIVTGVVVLLLLTALGILSFIFWITAPVALLSGFVMSLSLIFTSFVI